MTACRFVNTKNGCRNGDSCPFEHSSLKKTINVSCKFFNTPTGCTNGDKCRFKHVIHEQKTALNDGLERTQDDDSAIFKFFSLALKRMKPDQSRIDIIKKQHQKAQQDKKLKPEEPKFANIDLPQDIICHIMEFHELKLAEHLHDYFRTDITLEQFPSWFIRLCFGYFADRKPFLVTRCLSFETSHHFDYANDSNLNRPTVLFKYFMPHECTRAILSNNGSFFSSDHVDMKYLTNCHSLQALSMRKEKLLIASKRVAESVFERLSTLSKLEISFFLCKIDGITSSELLKLFPARLTHLRIDLSTLTCPDAWNIITKTCPALKKLKISTVWEQEEIIVPDNIVDLSLHSDYDLSPVLSIHFNTNLTRLILNHGRISSSTAALIASMTQLCQLGICSEDAAKMPEIQAPLTHLRLYENEENTEKVDLAKLLKYHHTLHALKISVYSLGKESLNGLKSQTNLRELYIIGNDENNDPYMPAYVSMNEPMAINLQALPYLKHLTLTKMEFTWNYNGVLGIVASHPALRVLRTSSSCIGNYLSELEVNPLLTVLTDLCY
jgi:hypothetical protein